MAYDRLNYRYFDSLVHVIRYCSKEDLFLLQIRLLKTYILMYVLQISFSLTYNYPIYQYYTYGIITRIVDVDCPCIQAYFLH